MSLNRLEFTMKVVGLVVMGSLLRVWEVKVLGSNPAMEVEYHYGYTQVEDANSGCLPLPIFL